MSGIPTTSAEILQVPVKCIDCPAICVLANEAGTRHNALELEVATSFSDDEKRHETRQRLLGKYTSRKTQETLGEKRQRVAGELDQQDESLESDQYAIDELTDECDGPAILQGETPLGRVVVVMVCGSEAYGANTDRFFVGPGHGQTQHEQVHVNRQLWPGEES